MNSRQVARVLALAERPAVKSLDWDLADRFFHAPPRSVYAAPEDLVPIIRYQAMQLNGEWDRIAYDECVYAMKRTVVLIEPPDVDLPKVKHAPAKQWTNQPELDMALAIERVMGTGPAISTLAAQLNCDSDRAAALLRRAAAAL